MIRCIERLCDGREGALADLDLHMSIVEKVERPPGIVARGDEQRPIGFVDVSHRDRPRRPGPASDRRDPGDLALEDEVVPDVARQRRPRCCQDLPSVWVDGA